jgi:predicted secreted protein
MSNLGMNGTDVLVKLDTGDSVENWVTIAGQRDVTMSESTNLIDVSSKDSGRHGNYLAGRITETIDLDALVIFSNAAYTALQTASRNGTAVRLQKFRTASGAMEEVDAVITTRDESFPDQDAAVMSISFQTDGAWESPS